jgi:hypothetical protein
VQAILIEKPKITKMLKLYKQCIIDGELTPELIRRKQELDRAMEAEFAAIESNKGLTWVPKERQYADVRQRYTDMWEQELSDAGYLVRPVFESVDNWYDSLTSLNEALNDPFGYGPYKDPEDPTLKVGDYIKATHEISGDWYPARVTEITRDFIRYAISGWGFTKEGTIFTSARAKQAFKTLRTRKYRDRGVNEAVDISASKKFWAAANNKQIDLAAFHAAYDDELTKLGLMDVFTADGTFGKKAEKSYGRFIAAAKVNPESWAIKALKKLWGLYYRENTQFSTATEANKAADEERQRRAELRRQQEESDRAAKAAKLLEYEQLVKSYLDKVSTKVLVAYEQATGNLPEESIHLEEDGEVERKSVLDKPIFKYGLYFKGWRNYYSIPETKFTNEALMLEMLTKGFTNATQVAREANGTKKFESLDIFAKNNSAEVLLLGDSGVLYQLRKDRSGKIEASANGGNYGPADIVNEPYKVIYTKVSWSDNNYRTNRDSNSATYYSWNSKYANMLGGRLPTKFGRTDGYMGSYIETIKIVSNSSAEYSHEAGIDSWAITRRHEVATD